MATSQSLTREAFKQSIQPAHDVRKRIMELVLMLSAALTERAIADRAALSAARRIVYAVKGDAKERDDEELYAARGYVSKSERRTGLARRLGISGSQPD